MMNRRLAATYAPAVPPPSLAVTDHVVRAHGIVGCNFRLVVGPNAHRVGLGGSFGLNAAHGRIDRPLSGCRGLPHCRGLAHCR